MLTCKVALPDSPHPHLLIKILDFGHFMLLDRMNSVFSFKKIFFFISGCRILPKKFSVCPKNNDFARLRGLQTLSAPLARMPVIESFHGTHNVDGWTGGVSVGHRTLDQIIMGSIPYHVTTLGKLFTSMCLCHEAV